MLNQNQIADTIDTLRKGIDPAFIYIMEETDVEKLLHILVMCNAVADIFYITQLEKELSKVVGAVVQIYNTDECDADFAGEILEYGSLVYCKNESMRRRFMGDVAQKNAVTVMKRDILISRMQNCDSTFLM